MITETSEAKAGSAENDQQPQDPEQQAIDSWLRTIPDDPEDYYVVNSCINSNFSNSIAAKQVNGSA